MLVVEIDLERNPATFVKLLIPSSFVKYPTYEKYPHLFFNIYAAAAAGCSPKATVDEHDAPWGNSYVHFGPEFTLTYQKCEGSGTLYLFNDRMENQKVVYDFGCEAVYDKVTLRNTQNGNLKNRWVQNL